MAKHLAPAIPARQLDRRSDNPYDGLEPEDRAMNFDLLTRPVLTTGTASRDVIDWIGWDRLLFATDYPHWDYDDPSRVPPNRVTEARWRAFLLDNASAVYGL
jgi:hypothetical protein